MLQFPLQIPLRRSRYLSALVVLLHALGGGCISALPWSASARVLLLAVIALSAWQALRPAKIIGLRLSERGELAFLGPAGEPRLVKVLADSTVFKQLVILRVREEECGRRSTLVLLPDSMPSAQFRLLRLWLRWLADPTDPAAGGA